MTCRPIVRAVLVWSLALTCAGCEVPGQSVEGRDKYHHDVMSTQDIAGDDTAAPDDAAQTPDARDDGVVDAAADGDAADSRQDVDDGGAIADTAADGQVHDGGDTEPDTAPEPDLSCYGGTGTVVGSFCPPCGSNPNPLVTVRIVAEGCDGVPWTLETHVRQCSHYVLEDVPAGIHTLQISGIDDHGGLMEGEIVVEAGVTTERHPYVCGYCGTCSNAARVAVLTGAYDHTEAILDGQGIIYDLHEGDTAADKPDPTRSGLDLLGDRSALSDYQTVFINSGHWPALFADGIDTEPMRTRVDNLRDFVLDGGNLVVTDWAWLWLEAAFPEAIAFVGDPGPGEDGQAVAGLSVAPAVGAATDVPVVIEDAVLASALERATLTVPMIREAWVVPVAAHPQAHVLMRAPQVTTYAAPASLTDVPMMVAWQPTAASGTVYYVAFGLAFVDVTLAEEILQTAIFNAEVP